MGIDTIQKVFLLGKWKYFKQQVENKLRENNTNIDYYYDSYTITFNNDSVKNLCKELIRNDIQDIKNNINHNMVESIKKSTMRRHDKAIKECGLEQNIYKQEKFFEQEKIDYVIEQEQLTMTLISNKAPEFKKIDLLQTIIRICKKFWLRLKKDSIYSYTCVLNNSHISS